MSVGVRTRLVAAVAVVLGYEAVMAAWVFGPLRTETTTYTMIVSGLVLHFLVGLLLHRMSALLATIPPVIAAAPLPRPDPDADLTPFGAMLVFFWPLGVGAMSAGIIAAMVVTRWRRGSRRLDQNSGV